MTNISDRNKTRCLTKGCDKYLSKKTAVHIRDKNFHYSEKTKDEVFICRDCYEQGKWNRDIWEEVKGD